uniref:Glutaredoxin domain-containing protein n=1 Tax=Musa acuminata subsp. malaccensis TaxID=214687 RepID=A0A804JJX6_MUSAM
MWSPWRKLRLPRRGAASPTPPPPLLPPPPSSFLRSSSSFKDVRSLLGASPSPSPMLSPAPVFHRVRSASSAFRTWCTPPEDLFGLPPGEEKRIVLYYTSLRVVRQTFDDCADVRTILRGLRVAVDERDVSLDAAFMRELKGILGGRRKPLGLPQVFIGGRHFGGAEEIRRLYETGELKRYVEGAAPAVVGVCEGCGDFRFVLCRSCSGSRRCYSEKGGGGFRTCTACNENGLVRCPLCCAHTTV